MISGENIRIEVNSEKNHKVEFTCSLNSKSQEKERIIIELTETKVDKCQLGRLKLTTKKTIFGYLKYAICVRAGISLHFSINAGLVHQSLSIYIAVIFSGASLSGK